MMQIVNKVPSKGLVVFGHENCYPCKQLLAFLGTPTGQKWLESQGVSEYHYYDLTNEPLEVVQRLGIMGIPAIRLYDGELYENVNRPIREVGYGRPSATRKPEKLRVHPIAPERSLERSNDR